MIDRGCVRNAKFRRFLEYAEKQLADAEEIHDKLQWQLKRAKKMIREAKTELRSVIAREDG